LEYAINFVKARGGTSRKVFQISENVYAPGTYSLNRRHSFADRTTRKHHAGKHTLTIIANGVEQAQATFAVVQE
jgi:hypothetical protein